jgi:hypothetical protein
MVKAGVMRGGYELKPVATATSVRFTNGKAKTVDGPFAETRESRSVRSARASNGDTPACT